MSLILHIPLIDDDGQPVDPNTLLADIQGYTQILSYRLGGIMPARVLIVAVRRLHMTVVRAMACVYRVGRIHIGDTVAKFTRWVHAVMPVWEDTMFTVRRLA